MLYWACSSKIAQHPAVEPSRLPQGPVGRPDLTGAFLGCDGFAYQGASRAQASRQQLVQIWLAPAVSRAKSAEMTRVITEGLPVCFEMMNMGPCPQPRRKRPSFKL